MDPSEKKGYNLHLLLHTLYFINEKNNSNVFSTSLDSKCVLTTFVLEGKKKKRIIPFSFSCCLKRSVLADFFATW